MGIYEPKQVNGRNVWQAQGGVERFLFYGATNAWFVATGGEEWCRGVDAGVLTVSSTASTPDQIAATSTWQIFDSIADQWQPTPRLKVRLCSVAEKQAAAERIGEVQARALSQAQQARMLVVEGHSEDPHIAMGLYELVPGKVENKRAVWRRQNNCQEECEERFLYYAITNEWIISDKEDMDAGESEGYLSIETCALTPDQAFSSERWRDLQEDYAHLMEVRNMRARVLKSKEEEEELEHYAKVQKAFRDYTPCMMLEMARREKAAGLLSDRHKARLPEGGMETKLVKLREAVHKNQVFLSRIVSARSNFGTKAVPSADTKLSAERHMSKVRNTLHQCCREWSEEGAAEREQCFGMLVNELCRLLPVDKENMDKQRVLVPGAGLGRLPLEIAGKGYACQGNEFCYFMLEMANFLLNYVAEAGTIEIQPWIDQPSSVVKTQHMLRTSRIPDVSPRSFFADPTRTPDFSLCAGEFLDVYGGQDGAWDSIATSFFIDTAPNVIEYIEAFYKLLKPGGVWINVGPLVYHWQTFGEGADGADKRYAQSVELSYQEVRHVIESCGFEYQKEEFQECRYTSNHLAMKNIVYNCVFFSVRKPLEL
jgi:carnosine N-methyltransferase